MTKDDSAFDTSVACHQEFLERVVRFLTEEAGLSQFLDIGTGIPPEGSTREVRPESRTVHVDSGPPVPRDVGSVLARAADTLDFGRPIGALLHAVSDAYDPQLLVTALTDSLPSGSYLALTHGPGDPAEIERFFDGLSLVEPGLVPVQDWRPGPGEPASDGGITIWGGVARKP